MPEWVLGMPCMWLWLDQNGSAEVGITWWAARVAVDHDDRVAGDLDDHNTPLSQRPKNPKRNLLLYSCSNKILIKYTQYSHFNDCHQPALVLRYHSSPTWSTMASLTLGGVILMIRCLIIKVPAPLACGDPDLCLMSVTTMMVFEWGGYHNICTTKGKSQL